MAPKERSIKSDLEKLDRHRIKPKEYDDAPELTDEQLASAVVTPGKGRPADDRSG